MKHEKSMCIQIIFPSFYFFFYECKQTLVYYVSLHSNMNESQILWRTKIFVLK